jgi:voltage-gated potassium channel
LVLSFCVIPLLTVETFATIEPAARETLNITYAVIWAVFVADYVTRLLLAEDRRTFIKQEWLELTINVVSAPIPVPWLTWTRWLRSIRALRLVRLVRIGGAVTRGAGRALEFPETSNSQLAMAFSIFVGLTLISGVLVLTLEEGMGGSTINTMGDALYWAVGTVTAVGSGDINPVTSGGRLVAAGLMLVAVGFVGVVASNLVSRLLHRFELKHRDPDTRPEEQTLAQMQQQLQALQEQLDSLTHQIAKK